MAKNLTLLAFLFASTHKKPFTICLIMKAVTALIGCGIVLLMFGGFMAAIHNFRGKDFYRAAYYCYWRWGHYGQRSL